MHFSEDDLRSALRREDPGTDFTHRVMARVNRESQGVPIRRTKKPQAEGHSPRLWSSPFRTALAGAFLVVFIAATWSGVAMYRDAHERQAGELAERQAIAALRITAEKLNHVIDRVQTANAQSKGGSDEEN